MPQSVYPRECAKSKSSSSPKRLNPAGALRMPALSWEKTTESKIINTLKRTNVGSARSLWTDRIEDNLRLITKTRKAVKCKSVLVQTRWSSLLAVPRKESERARIFLHGLSILQILSFAWEGWELLPKQLERKPIPNTRGALMAEESAGRFQQLRTQLWTQRRPILVTRTQILDYVSASKQ